MAGGGGEGRGGSNNLGNNLYVSGVKGVVDAWIDAVPRMGLVTAAKEGEGGKGGEGGRRTEGPTFASASYAVPKQAKFHEVVEW